MVDFPEGYGFAPNESRWLVQSTFVVSVGVYENKTSVYNPTIYRSRTRGGSPFAFVPIGHVVKNDKELFGYLLRSEVTSPEFTGTLQNICTAMCTVHRLTRGRT